MRDSAVGAVHRRAWTGIDVRADYCFEQGASTKASSTRIGVDLVARLLEKESPLGSACVIASTRKVQRHVGDGCRSHDAARPESAVAVGSCSEACLLTDARVANRGVSRRLA